MVFLACSAAMAQAFEPDASVLDAGPTDAGVLSLEVPRADVPEGLEQDVNLGWTLVRTFVVLGLVIAIAYLTLNVGLRKLMGVAGPLRQLGLVRVLERVSLDPKRTLFVVRAGNEVLLLGAGEGSLSLITKLDTAEVDALVESAAQHRPQLSPFLTKLLGRPGPKKAG